MEGGRAHDGTTADRPADDRQELLRRVERPEAQREIHEERYRLLADNVPDQVWTARLDGQLDYVNRRVVEYFGVPFDAVLGAGWVDVLHPDDRVDVLSRWSRSLATGEPYEVEFRLRRADGQYRAHIGRALPQRDATGAVVKWFGTNTDVEDQRRAEAALGAREERERFLADAGPLLASSFDTRQNLRALAAQAVPVLGDFCFFDLADEVGLLHRVAWQHGSEGDRAWFDQVQSSLAPRREAPPPIGTALSTGETQLLIDVDETWMRQVASDDGQLQVMRRLGFHSMLVVPLQARNGTLGALTFGFSHPGRRYVETDCALAVSLASRVAVAIENARLYHQLLAAVEARDELASIVSHDLRNPINTILVAASLLDRTGATDQQRRHLEIIRRAGGTMVTLIEDLLDASRIESGRLKVSVTNESIASIVDEACEAFRARAAEVPIALVTAMAPQLPPVLADRSRVAQVLANLLGNALKFTPAGGQISVGAQRDDQCVRVSVADTGVGIAAGNLPHVFDRFWQAKRASRAGAGLGLAIVKGIVESHGGRIWVDSREGQGSTFHFTLPIAVAP